MADPPRDPVRVAADSQTEETLAPSPDVHDGKEVAEVKEEGIVEDVVPEGGYGWVLVASIAGINAASWGINQAFGVYISFFIEHSYYEGGDPLKYAFAGGLSVCWAMLCAPLANYVTKTYHFRLAFLIGIVTAVLGQTMAGIAPNFGVYLFCQGILFGSGLGFTLVPGQPLLAHWFNKKLSLAQGLSASGSGLGGLIFSNTTRLAIDTVGIKWSLVINGLISLIVITPCAYLLRARKQVNAKFEPLQFSYLVHPGFLWIWLWGAFAMMGFFISLYSLASYATNGLGLTQTKGAALSSILSAFAMLGRIGCGYALDKGGRINMTIIFQTIAGVSCLAIWLPSRSFGVLALFGIVQGATGGIVWSASPPIIGQVVGVQNLGSALAVFWVAMAIPGLIAQPIAIWLLNYSVDHLGRTGAEAYSISIGFCGGLFLLSALLLFGAKVYCQKSWKILHKI